MKRERREKGCEWGKGAERRQEMWGRTVYIQCTGAAAVCEQEANTQTCVCVDSGATQQASLSMQARSLPHAVQTCREER